MDIIIDIETLGTKPGCRVIEIGACAVDPAGVIVANFSRRVPSGLTIDNVRQVAEGFVGNIWNIDSDTAAWWLADQERAETLRRILSRSLCIHEHCALYEFCDWMIRQRANADESIRVWANGPQFDLVLLQSAFDGYDIRRPWSCRQERCVRTALEQAGYVKGSVAWEETGPRHRALCDARHEARKLWRSGALGETAMLARRLRERGTVGEVR